LFVDPCLLQRVQLALRQESFERGDFALDRGHLHDAGADRRAIDDHGAGPALPEAASKARTLQAEVIAKNVEQRRRWFDIQRMRAAVHFKCDFAHSRYSLETELYADATGPFYRLSPSMTSVTRKG